MPTLIVQMGHCFRRPIPGRDVAIGTPGEQEYAVRVADACEQLLDGRGGWSVQRVLADVPDVEYRGDAFVAVHCNGNDSPAVRGASVGHQNVEGRTAAAAWKAAYLRRGWTGGFEPDNNTVNLARYYGVRRAIAQGNRRAVIVESGYLTSPADRVLLQSLGGPERVALSIADAFGIPTSEEDIVASIDDLRQVLREELKLFPLPNRSPNVRGGVTLPDGSRGDDQYGHVLTGEAEAADGRVAAERGLAETVQVKVAIAELARLLSGTGTPFDADGFAAALAAPVMAAVTEQVLGTLRPLVREELATMLGPGNASDVDGVTEQVMSRLSARMIASDG